MPSVVPPPSHSYSTMRWNNERGEENNAKREARRKGEGGSQKCCARYYPMKQGALRATSVFPCVKVTNPEFPEAGMYTTSAWLPHSSPATRRRRLKRTKTNKPQHTRHNNHLHRQQHRHQQHTTRAQNYHVDELPPETSQQQQAPRHHRSHCNRPSHNLQPPYAFIKTPRTTKSADQQGTPLDYCICCC